MKLSHDPNNTKWTNDTQSFGHKIMTSQGWQPGQYLGARDALHAEFHTEANASHIRVSIKDDNLGLGAKLGSGVGHGECTGLDAFKNLLGRLNGQDQNELEREQKCREDLRRAVYSERRWGSVRFVQGGFLIGDKIQHLIDAEAERIRKLTESTSSDSSSSSELEEETRAPARTPKKSKKRKIDIMEEKQPKVVAVKVRKPKSMRKSKATSQDAEEVAAALGDIKISKKKTRKSKKDDKSKPTINDTHSNMEIRQRKRDKKQRRKENDLAKQDGEESVKDLKKKKPKRIKAKSELDDAPESTGSFQLPTKESTPANSLDVDSGRSTPIMQGRHAVRARNIAQKRLASMDVASLNQVSSTDPPYSDKNVPNIPNMA